MEGILVEAHGMLMDLIVFGILILWIDLRRNKQVVIARYMEEIDDFREWKSEEAVFRIRGNIRRLNKRGVTQIDLHMCYLKKASLRDANLRGATLQQADLGEAYLRGSIFDDASLDTAYLGYADLRGASFRRSNLTRVRLQYAKLRSADFRDAILVRAAFNQADLRSANFRGADMSECILVGAELIGANLKDTLNLDVTELKKAKTLQYAKLDDSVMQIIKKDRPDLLEKFDHTRN